MISLWKRTVQREAGLCDSAGIGFLWAESRHDISLLSLHASAVIFPIIEAIVRPGARYRFQLDKSDEQVRSMERRSALGFNCANRGGFEGFVSLKEYAVLASEREMNTEYLFIYLFASSNKSIKIVVKAAFNVKQIETKIVCT